MNSIRLFILLLPTFLVSCQHSSNLKQISLMSPPDLFHDLDIIKSTLHGSDSVRLSNALVFTPESFSKETAETVRKSLRRQYLQYLEKDMIDSASRRFSFFELDLNNDGDKEILVGFNGMDVSKEETFSVLLLKNDGTTLSGFTEISGPVYISRKKSNQWPHIIIQRGDCFYVIKPDGTIYPSQTELHQPHRDPEKGEILFTLDFQNESLPKFSF